MKKGLHQLSETWWDNHWNRLKIIAVIVVVCNTDHFLWWCICSGIDFLEKVCCFRKLFFLESALTLDNTFVTFDWLILILLHTRLLIFPTGLHFYRAFDLESLRPLDISLPWFAWGCVVLSGPSGYHNICNSLLASGSWQKSSLPYRMRWFCQLRL